MVEDFIFDQGQAFAAYICGLAIQPARIRRHMAGRWRKMGGTRMRLCEQGTKASSSR